MPYPSDPGFQRYYRAPGGAPAEKPVSLADVKAQEHVDWDDDDAELQFLIDAAIAWLDGSGTSLDGHLGQAMVTQTWRLECFTPNSFGVLPIRYGPIQGIVSIETMQNGVYSVWDSQAYRLAQDNGCGIVVPNYGFTWPLHDLREDAIRVTFKAGYGDVATDVPSNIRSALMLDVRRRYDSDRDTPQMKKAIDDLLSNHRVIRV